MVEFILKLWEKIGPAGQVIVILAVVMVSYKILSKVGIKKLSRALLEKYAGVSVKDDEDDKSSHTNCPRIKDIYMMITLIRQVDDAVCDVRQNLIKDQVRSAETALMHLKNKHLERYKVLLVKKNTQDATADVKYMEEFRIYSYALDKIERDVLSGLKKKFKENHLASIDESGVWNKYRKDVEDEVNLSLRQQVEDIYPSFFRVTPIELISIIKELDEERAITISKCMTNARTMAVKACHQEEALYQALARDIEKILRGTALCRLSTGPISIGLDSN